MRVGVKECAIVAGLFALAARPCSAASLLPLESEAAAALPHGSGEAVLGFAYVRDLRFPAFTPAAAIASQDLFSLPRLALNFGLGGWAEVQASFEMLYLDEKLSGQEPETTYGAGDARLFTKLYLLADRELLPAMGVRFGTKLPNAALDDRLGTDEADFHMAALASKDFGVLHSHLNLGLALLGNPGSTAPAVRTFDSGGQDDLFTWSLAMSSAPVAVGGGREMTLLVEVAGQEGSRFDNDRAAVRGGVQLGGGWLRIYAGLSAGLVAGSENIGTSFGLVCDFQPGRWFGLNPF